MSWWTDRGRLWYNVNSGNTVLWQTAGLEGEERSIGSDVVRCSNCDYEYNREFHDYCPDCECEDYWRDDDDDGPHMKEGYYQLKEYHQHFTTEYSLRARRYYWRNG